jgi:hypothetical protein
LRTSQKAFSAKNAILFDNMCLIVGKANGFNGAISYAFIAIFAVGFF